MIGSGPWTQGFRGCVNLGKWLNLSEPVSVSTKWRYYYLSQRRACGTIKILPVSHSPPGILSGALGKGRAPRPSLNQCNQHL